MSFEIKDSGERKVFASGMQRDTGAGKIDYTYCIKGPMLDRWAVHMGKGAKKYDRDNWMKANGPEELERYEISAMRHLIQWLRGDTDEDHAAAVFFNVNGAEYVKDRMRAVVERDRVVIRQLRPAQETVRENAICQRCDESHDTVFPCKPAAPAQSIATGTDLRGQLGTDRWPAATAQEKATMSEEEADVLSRWPWEDDRPAPPDSAPAQAKKTGGLLDAWREYKKNPPVVDTSTVQTEVKAEWAPPENSKLYGTEKPKPMSFETIAELPIEFLGAIFDIKKED